MCDLCSTYNFEKGKKIAYYRALNSNPVFYSNKLITRTIARAALIQEVAFLKEFPEKLIKGYKDSKNRYLKKISAENEYKKLNNEEQAIVNKAFEGLDLNKCLKVFKNLKNYNEK